MTPLDRLLILRAEEQTAGISHLRDVPFRLMCAASGCRRKAIAKLLCKTHYDQKKYARSRGKTRDGGGKPQGGAV